MIRILGLFLLVFIYGAYEMIRGGIEDDYEDDGRVMRGLKIMTGALFSMAIIGALTLIFGGGA